MAAFYAKLPSLFSGTFTRGKLVRLRLLALILGSYLLCSGGSLIPAAMAEDDLEQTSPLYTEYNTFIGTANFLELLSTGSGTVSAKISIYMRDGTFQKAVRVDVPSKTEVDVDINTLVGLTNTYGVVKVEFNNGNGGARLQGRMSLYRVNSDGQTFSFAYSLPLRAPITNTSYTTGNTFDAQGRSFVVANWVSITNLDPASQTFTYKRYDQAGTLLTTQNVTLGSNERFDLSGGHESGENVFLNEIIPPTSTTPYLSAVVRYASNSTTGLASSYAFAMPVFAKGGSDDELVLPMVNQSGTCFTQTNWIEVVNVANTSNTVDVSFRDKNGAVFSTTTLNLGPRSQFHLYASALLSGRGSDRGTVRLQGSASDSVIGESVVYYHDCRSNRLQTAYNVQADTPRSVPLSGSFNRFIGIENQLFVAGGLGVPRSVELTLRSGDSVVHDDTFSLSNFAATVLNLNDDSFGTTADTYGLIGLDAASGDQLFGYNLRLRRSGTNNAEVDFAMPIPLR